jgi:transketolase
MPLPSKNQIKELENLCLKIRIEIIQMLAKAGSGHTAGPLGCVEEMVGLYFGGSVKYDTLNPLSESRDIVVLSCGHYAPVLYATLAFAGFYNLEKLQDFRGFRSVFQGHPHRGDIPGVETTSGPLGEGLSQAVGMALALKINRRKNHVFCLMSDGEQDEGNTWEAVLLANKYHLDNLVAIIDRNHIQITGPTEKVLPLDELSSKYKAFGWEVIEIDGNDLKTVIHSLYKAKNYKIGPMVIIANTVPGKGVKFMENKAQWHGKAPTPKEAERAIKLLQET